MSKASSIPPIFSVADLLAIAYRIELDAVERYGVLADQIGAAMLDSDLPAVRVRCDARQRH